MMATMSPAAVLFALVLSLHVVLNTAGDGETAEGTTPATVQGGGPGGKGESVQSRMWRAVCTDGISDPDQVTKCAKCFGDSFPQTENKDDPQTADYKAAQTCTIDYLKGKAADCGKYLLNVGNIRAFRTCALLSQVGVKLDTCMEEPTGEEFLACFYSRKNKA